MYKVEQDLRISVDKPNYKIMFHNKTHDLWLTYDTTRYSTVEEVEKAIKKLNKNGNLDRK